MTPEIQSVILDQRRSEDTFDIVLELNPGRPERSGSRAEQIAKLKAQFQTRAEPIKAAVMQSGGSIQAEAWINCIIKARVPGRALAKLRDVEGIVKIDVPHAITDET